MRIDIELFDEAGQAVRQRTVFGAARLVIGGGREDDFLVEGLAPGAYGILTDGQRQVEIYQGGLKSPIGQRWVLGVGEQTLRVTTRPNYGRPEQVTKGSCPRCGSRALTQRAIGGAYRSMARKQKTCSACGVVVLTMDTAALAVGAFSERSRTEWYAVYVTMRCPECLAQMRRCAFRTDDGEAEVERCFGCDIVVLEPEDQARLAGSQAP